MRLALLAFLVAACGGSAANLCDNLQLSLTCQYSNGQCVELTGLSTADQSSSQAGCHSRGGTQLTGLCPTSGRLGTCNIPPTGANTGVSCSPQAVINIRYFAPFQQADAATACHGVVGATWTPN